MINGHIEDKGVSSLSTMEISTVRCTGGCASTNQVDVETTVRYWSDVANWDSGKLPVANENVIIKSTWNMEYDIESANAV